MIQLDAQKHRENRHYYFDEDGSVWVRTSIAAKQLGINHITLNRDCRLALEERSGSLAMFLEYVKRDERGQWWVRSDLDNIYTWPAPGKAGHGPRGAYFFVRDLRHGPKPRY